MVILHKDSGDAMGRKFFAAIGLGKETARVTETFGRDHQQAGDGRKIDVHVNPHRMDLALLPDCRRIAELGIEDIMAGHRREPRVHIALLAYFDLVDGSRPIAVYT